MLVIEPIRYTYTFFSDLNVLRIDKLIQQRILLFMFKIHHYDIPTILLNLFRNNNVVHSHNTRT